MNRFFQTIRTLLAGKHRLYTYSVFELIAIGVIIAFFVLMLRLS